MRKHSGGGGGKRGMTLRGVFCSPESRSWGNRRSNRHDVGGTCFSRKTLLKMIRRWNEDRRDESDVINVARTDDIETLWHKLDEKMRERCDNEYCWRSIGGDNDIHESFLPSMPRSWHQKKTQWLTSTDISRVMTQYQKRYTDFLFIGPVPVDFDAEGDFGTCVVEELCRLNLSRDLVLRGKKRLGIIFNLDRHDEPGSHWVACFVDLIKKQILYYDSTGTPPPDEIRRLMDDLQHQQQYGGLEINVNHVRHQFKNTECGVYCLYFMRSMLEGMSFKNFCDTIVLDEEMNRMRKEFFNPL